MLQHCNNIACCSNNAAFLLYCCKFCVVYYFCSRKKTVFVAKISSDESVLINYISLFHYYLLYYSKPVLYYSKLSKHSSKSRSILDLNLMLLKCHTRAQYNIVCQIFYYFCNYFGHIISNIIAL